MITSAITAQQEEQEKTPSNNSGYYSVEMSNIIYANQIFIEHKSLTSQVDDLNKTVELKDAELVEERDENERLSTELDIRKELGNKKDILYQSNEESYKNTISHLKTNNFWAWLIAIGSTLTTIFVIAK